MGASRNYPGGNGQGVNYGDVTFMDGKTQLTFCNWINNSSLPNQNGTHVAKGGFGNGSFAFFGGNSFQVLFLRSNSNVNSEYITDDPPSVLFGTNQWVFVAYTWTTGPTWNIYVDGDSKAISELTAGNPLDIANSSLSMATGEFTNANHQMHGNLAYSTFYDSVLSLEQTNELRWNPFVIFSDIQFMAPGWNPSATNEIDIIQGTSGTPTNAPESFDGPPVGCFAAANQ